MSDNVQIPISYETSTKYEEFLNSHLSKVSKRKIIAIQNGLKDQFSILLQQGKS